MKHCAGLAFLKLWAISSLFLFSLTSSAQDIAVGTWRTHFSYNKAQIIVNTGDKIFCAATNGLFSFDTNDNAVRKLSKIDGLSDVGISAMKYDPVNEVLIIGYRSGLVDLIFTDEINTIRDISESNLEGEKAINDITFGSNRIYLATDLGIIVINTNRSEIVENYVQIGIGGNEANVSEISFFNDHLFVRTDEGIQSGSTSNNLLDFNNWTHYESTALLSNLILVEDQYYALGNSDLFQLIESDWADTGINLPTEAVKLFSVDDQLITTSNGEIFRLENGGFASIETTSALNVNDVASNESGFLIADETIGLIDNTNNSLSPDGPLSDDFSRIRVINNDVYGFHAPSPFTYDGSENEDGFSLFSNGSWSTEIIAYFQNVSDVARFSNRLYFASIGDGLYDQLNDEILTQIPNSNPELDTIIVALKSGEKLWVSSFDNIDPIHNLTFNDEWTSYPNTDLFENRYTSIDLTITGNVWLGGSSGSITVIDEGQNETDIISTSDGLPASFTDLDLSVDDDAWIATTRGPALFTNASFIGSSRAITPSFENRVLFDDEVINSVMTDGGNRIWFGTNRGLWVFDENTSEQVALFNESNSPIPSNNVLDLVYNPSNGEVFIHTDKGLVSFRSSSSFGKSTHQNVTVFPNPVRPGYTGLVGIKGVAKNVSIKITDVNGNLVKEITANGGTASWDLMDVTNTRVVTGVYFLFSSTADGLETFVGKVAVVR